MLGLSNVLEMQIWIHQHGTELALWWQWQIGLQDLISWKRRHDRFEGMEENAGAIMQILHACCTHILKQELKVDEVFCETVEVRQ